MSKRVDEGPGTSLKQPNCIELNSDDRTMECQRLAQLIGSLLAHRWLREHAGADHRKSSDSVKDHVVESK